MPGVGVPQAATDQEGTEPAPEAVRPVQPGHRHCARLLRHPVAGRQHREDQHRAAGVPEQVNSAHFLLISHM